MKILKNKYLYISFLLISLLFAFSFFTKNANADGLAPIIDDTSIYGPTQIINGDFSEEPWNSYKFTYPGYFYSNQDITSAQMKNDYSIPSVGNSYFQRLPFNPVDGGWNTTEQSIFGNTYFEWVAPSAIGNYNSTLGGTGYCVEMNANNNAIFFQDLTTAPGSIMRWKIKLS